MRDDRRILAAIVKALEGKAADAHALGMTLTRRAARVEQLAKMSTDAQCTGLVDALIGGGCVSVHSTDIKAVNSSGGNG